MGPFHTQRGGMLSKRNIQDSLAHWDRKKPCRVASSFVLSVLRFEWPCVEWSPAMVLSASRLPPPCATDQELHMGVLSKLWGPVAISASLVYCGP